MITNQTKPAAGKTDENKPVELMKFEVAGSPLCPAAKAAVQPKRSALGAVFGSERPIPSESASPRPEV